MMHMRLDEHVCRQLRMRAIRKGMTIYQLVNGLIRREVGSAAKQLQPRQNQFGLLLETTS